MKLFQDIVDFFKDIPSYIEISKRKRSTRRAFFSIAGLLLVSSLILSITSIYCEQYFASVGFLVIFLVISLTTLACFIEVAEEKEGH